jgi:hypothetical protein
MMIQGEDESGDTSGVSVPGSKGNKTPGGFSANASQNGGAQPGVPAGFDPAAFMAAMGGGQPQAPFVLEGADRRKLIKEVKDEIKPIISETCDFQITKANAILKQQLRKIENDLTLSTQKLTRKVDREVKAARDHAENITELLS